MPKELSELERRFVDAYIGQAEGNGTKAAELAGYSQKSARAQASRLLTRRNIADAIAQRRERREILSDVSVARVLKEMARIGFADVRKLFNEDGSLKAFKDMDDDTAAALAAVDVVEMAGGMKVDTEGASHVPMYTKKVKLWDKNSALEKIAKHLGLFVERHNVSVSVDIAGARERLAGVLAGLAGRLGQDGGPGNPQR